MNERHASAIKSLVDLAYSAAALGIIAYAVRGEIRAAFTRQRAAFDKRRREVEADKLRMINGRRYLDTIRDRIIAEEHDAPDDGGPVLGMEP